MGPLPYFSCCDVSSSVRIPNTVWNTKAVGKAFSESMDGSFDRSITGRKDKSISRINIYSTKDYALPFL